MKFDVIADVDGNVVGTMVVNPSAHKGYLLAIKPASHEHSLHHVEVSDDFATLSTDELHSQLKAHLRKTPAA